MAQDIESFLRIKTVCYAVMFESVRKRIKTYEQALTLLEVPLDKEIRQFIRRVAHRVVPIYLFVEESFPESGHAAKTCIFYPKTSYCRPRQKIGWPRAVS